MSVLNLSATFPGYYESLPKIAEFIKKISNDAGFNIHETYNIEMAVDEACSNIIEHGYGGEGQGEIECNCKVDDVGLIIILKDHGRHFDPSSIPLPDINAPIEGRLGHGLGLFFMQKLMDEIRFEFSDKGGNTLTLVKRKEHPSDGNKKVESQP